MNDTPTPPTKHCLLPWLAGLAVVVAAMFGASYLTAMSMNSGLADLKQQVTQIAEQMPDVDTALHDDAADTEAPAEDVVTPNTIVEEETIALFRLTVDRERGDTLNERDIEVVHVPVAYVRAFGTDAIRESEGTVGRPAGGFGRRPFRMSARRGEILREGMFMRDTSNLGLEVMHGNRLVSLSVNTDNQPPNLAPDDFVDIYANIQRRTGTQSAVVMERVQVRLVSSRVLDPHSNRTRNTRYGSITIEVAESEVRKLADIQTRIAGNTFIIVVRGPDDRQSETGLEPGTVNPEVLQLLGLE